ncbi:MAG TPA: metalloregulator ArsR/SmtB family transcription factor [Bryobacteraceae bacterium]|nr:metalloregulator ArsR/SmtB family transcription factor [Bryobacteraceae bacterium]
MLGTANQPIRLDAVFGTLSDPIRRAMLSMLARGELSVTRLSEPFPVSAPAISKHLRVLEASGLITRRKTGRVHYCRLRAEPLWEAGSWIEAQRAFWERQFDALEKYLDEEQEECKLQPGNEPGTPSGSKGASKRPLKKSSARGRIRKS